MVPGENKGILTLCGTNIFVVGSGKNRLLVDAGEPRNLKFIKNMRKFLNDFGVHIDVKLAFVFDDVGNFADALTYRSYWRMW
jgi:hypothetical protein